MKLVIDERRRSGQSRVSANKLISMQLRLLEQWRETAGGLQEAMVLMAIVVITGDKLIRSAPDPGLRNIANPVPLSLLGTCNLSSIAAATGINRETVRRIVNRLIAEGRLIRSAEGSINFSVGWVQRGQAHRLTNFQLDEFCRTANSLLRDGVLLYVGGSVEPTPSAAQINE